MIRFFWLGNADLEALERLLNNAWKDKTLRRVAVDVPRRQFSNLQLNWDYWDYCKASEDLSDDQQNCSELSYEWILLDFWEE